MFNQMLSVYWIDVFAGLSLNGLDKVFQFVDCFVHLAPIEISLSLIDLLE